ncbi:MULTISPECIES: lysophospholipid acyltransferase family protein [Mameliella]|uniref:lysophospholipid acyltransferase family protein n=1 Tax=Mameliella TaxID=1434019 RepID=UPI000B533940|nr:MULTISPECIES: lysophospholipid acyltransferase family protein [Mameliella]MCR9272007.1 1-acyl-sn-glycerol-3-phosphate acyltransferase [Paracoccaceae bacterium]OWV62791.1 1-acyl-sn-glycerol-3-phosphate acyltransferase [Mameliella alba]
MSQTWNGAEEPDWPPIDARGWLRVAWRAPLMALVIFGCLALLLLVRLVERPLCGTGRPVTPHITRFVCRTVLLIMGLPVEMRGQRMKGPGAIVANHTSWLDIFVLNSRKTIYFVSKAEVAAWPGIGWLARATGTLFINRDRREAQAQTQAFEDRLLNGHRLLFFPEGTSTDGLRVLPFKTTLFAAFYSERLHHRLQVQPVSVVYHPPQGAHPRFYGWWGDMDFGASLLRILAAPRQGHVVLNYHPPVRVDDFANRKSLAHALEIRVREGHTAELGPVAPELLGKE